MLSEYRITSSMGRRGYNWHTACSKKLLGSLKVEQLHGQRVMDARQAMDEVVAWEFCCNRTRLHSTLVYASPTRVEENWHANQYRQARTCIGYWMRVPAASSLLISQLT